MMENGTEAVLDDGPSHLATSLGAAVMMLFFIEGLAGNLWIFLAIATSRKMWNVINIFIASLCVNDLLTICFVVALIIDSYIWGGWRAGDIMCKLNPEFTVAFVGTSLWHTALIAIHRFVVVVHNNLYKRMNHKVYIWLNLLATRVIPIACTAPGMNLETSGYMPKLLRCIFLPDQKARIISVTIVQIILPCVIVVLCYVFIFGYVCRFSGRIQSANVGLRKEIQITKMFGVVFFAILLGFIPYAVIRNADRDNHLNADVYVIVTVLYGIATCSNPLVYGAMSNDIRKACVTSKKRILSQLRLNLFSVAEDNDVSVPLSAAADASIAVAHATWNRTNSHIRAEQPDHGQNNGEANVLRDGANDE